MENTKYAVLRMLTDITISNGVRNIDVPLTGMDGYLPVYNDHKKAAEMSENGTYQIIELTMGEGELDDEQ